MEATHDRIAEAFAQVPREPFLPTAERSSAGDNVPLPIGEGQTNSQPSTVADMFRLLDPHPGDTILDLGSGSGWTSALLAVIAGSEGWIVGVERHPGLIARARGAVDEYFAEAGLGPDAGAQSPASIEFIEARPGVLGAPEFGPFDRILVSAGADHLPDALVEQLAFGGVMVIPVGEVMLRVERRDEDIRSAEVTRHGRYRFVPLVVE